MNEINDYIWYIVGGIALLFIIIGFIADKSGLAKKTFSKDSGSNEKKNTGVSNVAPIAVPVENFNSMVPNTNEDNFVVENNEVLEPVVMSDEEISPVQVEEVNVINGDVVEEQPIVMEQNVEEPVQVMSDEFASTEEPLYLNEEQEQAQEQEILLNEDEGETDSVWDIDSEEVIVEDADSSVAAENAEEDWGMEPVTSSDDSSDLEDVELPALDDINASIDDDVWKF